MTLNEILKEMRTSGDPQVLKWHNQIESEFDRMFIPQHARGTREEMEHYHKYLEYEFERFRACINKGKELQMHIAERNDRQYAQLKDLRESRPRTPSLPEWMRLIDDALETMELAGMHGECSYKALKKAVRDSGYVTYASLKQK